MPYAKQKGLHTIANSISGRTENGLLIGRDWVQEQRLLQRTAQESGNMKCFLSVAGLCLPNLQLCSEKVNLTG